MHPKQQQLQTWASRRKNKWGTCPSVHPMDDAHASYHNILPKRKFLDFWCSLHVLLQVCLAHNMNASHVENQEKRQIFITTHDQSCKNFFSFFQTRFKPAGRPPVAKLAGRSFHQKLLSQFSLIVTFACIGRHVRKLLKLIFFILKSVSHCSSMSIMCHLLQ